MDQGAASRSPLARAKGSSSTRVLDDWYVLCRSTELRRRPLARELYDIPIVVYRAGDRVGALLDRCPHRNAPLSLGRVSGETLQCGYHGWQFDESGRCRFIPGRDGEADHEGRRVPAFAAAEQDGFVWVYATPDVDPVRPPPRLAGVGEPGFTVAYQQFEVEGGLHAAAENTLDVPHTAYLHAGLFRGAGRKNRVEVVVRRFADRCEAEFLGEPRPSGLVGRVLSPAGGVVTHFDRFILPCIAQVEYGLGPHRIYINNALTPVSSERTRFHTAVAFKVPVPGFLVSPVLGPVARRIFRQDAVILRAQSRNVARFGGEQFVNTELDVLGPQILRLLRNAERGERVAPEETEIKRVTMTV